MEFQNWIIRLTKYLAFIMRKKNIVNLLSQHQLQ